MTRKRWEPERSRTQRAARALIRALRRKGTEFRCCQDGTIDVYGPPLPLVMIQALSIVADEICMELKKKGPMFPERATNLKCRKCQAPLELIGFNPGKDAAWRLWECPVWAEESIL